jgi:hypothetical protein
MPMGILGQFESLFAEFVSGLMISFAVGLGGNSVGVGGQIVKFRGSIVHALGHDLLLTGSMQTSKERTIGETPWDRHKP